MFDDRSPDQTPKPISRCRRSADTLTLLGHRFAILVAGVLVPSGRFLADPGLRRLSNTSFRRASGRDRAYSTHNTTRSAIALTGPESAWRPARARWAYHFYAAAPRTWSWPTCITASSFNAAARVSFL